MSGPDDDPFREAVERLQAAYENMSLERVETLRRWNEEYERQRAKGVHDAVMSSMNVPRSFWKMSHDLKWPSEADGFYRKVLSYWELMKKGEPGILILSGRSGIGKTHLGCWMLYDLVYPIPDNGYVGRKGIYISAFEAASRYKKADGFNSSVTREQVKNSLIYSFSGRYDFAVIDEVGMDETLRDYERQMLYDYFNESECPVLLCTNRGLDSLHEFMNEATYDRIKSRNFAPPSTSELESWRKKGNLYDVTSRRS